MGNHFCHGGIPPNCCRYLPPMFSQFSLSELKSIVVSWDAFTRCILYVSASCLGQCVCVCVLCECSLVAFLSWTGHDRTWLQFAQMFSLRVVLHLLGPYLFGTRQTLVVCTFKALQRCMRSRQTTWATAAVWIPAQLDFDKVIIKFIDDMVVPVKTWVRARQ